MLLTCKEDALVSDKQHPNPIMTHAMLGALINLTAEDLSLSFDKVMLIYSKRLNPKLTLILIPHIQLVIRKHISCNVCR